MSNTAQKDAILACISQDEGDLEEMLELCSSAGYDVVDIVRQRRKGPDPRYYMGPGKIKGIEPVEGVEHLIIARELTPSQMYNISSVTGMKVIDRTRVILDIFRKRAHSPESRLQLEIADLQYQMPLMREYIHQGKLSERPGFMAGGEYKIDYYYELSKKRSSLLRAKLGTLRKKRSVRRKQRKRRGTHTISIAGYTNAGKSTLLNRLMDPQKEDKSAEEGGHMFTTVSTTTRSMKGGRNCIITDTVGFISDLPPWLVEGFMSTLEEIFSSEIILLVLDASDKAHVLRRKLKDSISILREGGTNANIILVLNKTDLLDDDGTMIPIDEVLDEEDMGLVSDVVPVSAVEEEGLDLLLQTIHSQLPPLLSFSFTFPPGPLSRSIISEILKDHDPDVTTDPRGHIWMAGGMEERWARSFAKKVMHVEGSTVIVDGIPLEKS